MLTRDPGSFALPAWPGMTRAPATRILVDLSHAAAGYVGVAQDRRLIFAMLAGLDGVEASGLLMPTGRHDLPVLRPDHPDAPALTAAVLHWMERDWHRPERRRFPLHLLQAAQALRQALRPGHALLPLEDRAQLGALWRILFARTLSPDQRARVLARDFYATDLSVSAVIDLCAQSPVPLRKGLAAEGFDAVLFCMPRPVRLPRGVRQLVRYHDSVPVTDTDTVVGWKAGLAHSRLVRACASDAIFVCNSPQSRDALVALDPSREAHAVVIPCAVAPPDTTSAGLDPRSVMRRHLTFRACGADAAPAGWMPPEPGMRYVLSVSTLEPRKNFAGLVRAWERVAARSDPDLRLIIVGGTGWREADALAQMRPGVASGRILHLHDLPQNELQAVMRGAACFAYPSFNEGFGYSPLEATQAGVPCVVSDIPVFRWIFGDAALYVDPYDTDSIAAGIERLTVGPGSADTVAWLRGRRARVVERFRPETVAQAWEALAEQVGEQGRQSFFEKKDQKTFVH